MCKRDPAHFFLFKYEITEVSGLCLPLDRAALEKRDRLASEGNRDAPVFDEARTFMQADAVVLTAPFWEGTFPAAVHAYIEQNCVTGLTVGYREGGTAKGLEMRMNLFQNMDRIT